MQQVDVWNLTCFLLTVLFPSCELDGSQNVPCRVSSSEQSSFGSQFSLPYNTTTVALLDEIILRIGVVTLLDLH